MKIYYFRGKSKRRKSLFILLKRTETYFAASWILTYEFTVCKQKQDWSMMRCGPNLCTLYDFILIEILKLFRRCGWNIFKMLGFVVLKFEGVKILFIIHSAVLMLRTFTWCRNEKFRFQKNSCLTFKNLLDFYFLTVLKKINNGILLQFSSHFVYGSNF